MNFSPTENLLLQYSFVHVLLFLLCLLFSSFPHIKCYNHISPSIPNTPIDFLNQQYQFSLVSTSFLLLPSLQNKTKWDQTPYLLPIILSTLFYTCRVYTSNTHLNTWGLAFLQSCQFLVYMDG